MRHIGQAVAVVRPIGSSLHELKELGGWQSLEMVLRYAHLVDNDHLAGVVKQFSGLTLADGGQRSYDLATLPAKIEGSNS